MTPKELRELTKPLSVLYVEDDDMLRVSTTKLLGQFFGSIEEAVDGRDGLDKFQKNNFDLVISDINMPNMNGFEMIKAIKEIRPNQAIIVTSAYNDSDFLLGLIDLNVDKFLLKPIDTSKLIDCLIHTAFYIQNQKDFYQNSIRIAELEAEVKSLKLRLPDTEEAIQAVQHTDKLSPEDLALLKLLEKKFSKAIYDIQMLGDYPDHLKDNLLTSLEKYAEILFTIENYKEIAISLNKLDQSIESDEELFQVNINGICALLEDVSANLTRTRKGSFYDKDAEVLIKSMKRVMASLRAY